MDTVYTTTYHSPVGPLRISGTAHFISEVAFENRELQPAGSCEPLPPLVVQCVEQLIEYFNNGRRQFDLPLVQPGTAFQQEVWNELVLIPFGKTISYIELARRTGDPKSTRAVATANGKNNIAIIVPCHRVIGANGQLLGYGGGLARKKWLLDHELKIAHGVQTLF